VTSPNPGKRHFGRVVDPLVRDDGGIEPSFEPPPAQQSTGDVRPIGDSPATSTPHPVRDKLLARIREARASQAPDGPPPPKDPFESLGGLSEELERIARLPTTTKRPALRLGGAPLSSNTVTLFGVLFGLTALASLFAALVHWAPRGEPTPQPPPAASSHIETPAAALPVPTAATLSNPALPNPVAPVPQKRGKLPGPWRIADAQGAQFRRVEGTIGDQPFLKAVVAAGVDLSSAYRILAALKSVKNLDHCGRNDHFTALLQQGGRLTAFEYIVSDEEIYQAKENDRGELQGQRLDLKVERVRARGAVLVGADSFEASAQRSGFEASLGTVLNKALEGHVSVEQFRPGDRLRIIAQEVTVLGEFEHYAGIEAVEYVPRGSESPTRVYYFQGEQTKGYINAQAQLLNEGGWRKPIKGAPITSRYNLKRFHPILHVIMPHTGTDFGASSGTPVGASLYGTVVYMGPLGPNGNFVGIQHKGGYKTGYSHLSRFADGLKVGDTVKTLQIIGYVGSTGRSTGPHLHFSVKKDDKFIDPETLHLDALGGLPAKERDAFATTKRSYDELLNAIAMPSVPAALMQATTMVAAKAAASPAATLAATTAAGSPGAIAAPAARSSEQAQVPAVAAPNPGTVPVNRSSIYLSDKDLLAAQPGSDDGESDE
jgi:hypothetical protein